MTTYPADRPRSPGPPAPRGHHRPCLTRFTAGILGVQIATLLTACSPGDKTPPPQLRAAVVIGTTANTQSLSASDPYLSSIFTSLVARQATISLIMADGRPFLIGSLDAKDQANNDLKRSQQDAGYVQQLIQATVAARPKTAQSNYLAALDLACGAVAGSRNSMVYVVGAGSSTAGLRLQDGLLTAKISTSSVVQQTFSSEAMPDLHGCPQIEWAGLGQVMAPQVALTPGARQREETIFRKLITGAGSHVQFVPGPLQAGPPVTSLPAISLIPVDDIPPTQVPLGEDDIGFVQGTSQFRDPGAALAAAQAAVEDLRSRDVDEIWVIGTTSSEGDARTNQVLSNERANAVKDLLVRGLGLDPGLLHPIGVGTDFPGFIDDRRTDGSLDPAKASQNRKVLLSDQPPA